MHQVGPDRAMRQVFFLLIRRSAPADHPQTDYGLIRSSILGHTRQIRIGSSLNESVGRLLRALEAIYQLVELEEL